MLYLWIVWFDCFRGHHQQLMSQMSQMSQMTQNPFGAMGMSNLMQPFGVPPMPGMSITGGEERRRDMDRRPNRTRDVMPQHPMMAPFGFGAMMPNMNSMMSNMHQMMVGHLFYGFELRK
jgi:flagellar hook assembly protein FlgD